MTKNKLRTMIVSDKEKLKIVLKQKCRCAYCNRPLKDLEVNWDHIIPVAYGRISAKSNFAAACRECNMAKGSRVMNQTQLTLFIAERMEMSGDIGETSPEGHEQFWTGVFSGPIGGRIWVR